MKDQDIRDECYVTDLGRADARQTVNSLQPPSCQSSPAAFTENLMTEPASGVRRPSRARNVFESAFFAVCQSRKAASSPLHWTVVFSRGGLSQSVLNL